MELYYNGERICEVHEAFGVPTTTMVNTTPDMVRPVVQYDVKVSDQGVFNPNDIEILVNNTEKGIIYTLSADRGSAPYKICVPSTVAFTAERENIELKYPKFRDWITDLRIDYAKRRMNEFPQQKILEIAEASGFMSLSHFSKTFSEKEGCSPARWRNSIGD